MRVMRGQRGRKRAEDDRNLWWKTKRRGCESNVSKENKKGGMAANPNIPPQPGFPERDRSRRTQGQFPWGLVGAVIAIICLGLIAYYVFR